MRVGISESNLIIRNEKYGEHINATTIFLAFYFVLLPFDLFTFSGFGSILRVASLMPLVCIAIRFNEWRICFNQLTGSLLIYLMYSLLTIMYSISSSDSFFSFSALARNIVFVLAVGGFCRYNNHEILILKKALALGGLLTIGLTFAFSGFSYDNRLSLYINGVQMDQNTLNGYMFFAFTFFTTLFWEKKRYFYALPLIGLFVFTFMTGSRGALIAMLGILLFAMLYFHKINSKRNNGIFAIMILTLIVVIMFPYISDLLPESVLKRFSKENFLGATYRIAIWESLLYYFKNSSILYQLFGNGFGTTAIISGMTYGINIVAHNVWIDQLITGGVFGLMCIINMQISVMKTALKTKDYFVIGAYIGYLLMSISLSIISYKPMWNCIIIILIIKNSEPIYNTVDKNV